MSIGVPTRVTDPATGRATKAPADVAAWVEHHPDLRVTRRATTSVGGRPAHVLDTVVAFTTPVKHGTDCERRYTSPFQPLEGRIVPCTLLAPGFDVPRGMRMRWIVVPGHPTLTIIADAFPAGEYRELLPKAQALVASIRFER
jgi:hypothetical protein